MFDRSDDPKAAQWAKEIKKRDNYICQVCRKYGVPLHSHHKNAWNLFVSQRYELNNGVCLCTTCHTIFHQIFGVGNNTEFQFQQFIKLRNITYEFLLQQKKD